MKNKGLIIGLIVFVLALAGCFAACGNVRIRLTGGLSEGELFRIEDKVCTEAEARLFLMNQKNRCEQAYGEKIWAVSLEDGSTFADYMSSELRDFLVQLKSMALMAESRGISLSDEEERQISEASSAYLSSVGEEALTYLGISQEEMEQLYRDYQMARRLADQISSLVQDEISDDEARVIEVQQIVFAKTAVAEDGTETPLDEGQLSSLRAEAQTAADRAAAGEAFATLQEEYSDEEAGSIQVSRADVEDSWEGAVFSMESGEISGVIETEESFYVVRCVNNLLSEETQANKETILEQRRAARFYQEYNAFTAELIPVYNEEGWEGLSFTDEDIPACTADFYEIYNQYFGA